MTNLKLTDVLKTQRLLLTPANENLAAMAADFYRRNEAHLAPWDPPAPMALATESFQQERLRREAAEMAVGAAYRWCLQPLAGPTIIVGKVSLTQIARAAFQNGMLGYAIDHQYEGLGLMREALQAVITHTFSSAINLHRIQANVRPENARSIGIMQRLGFEQEGLAREYLFIDGAWRDHQMFALRNSQFAGVPSRA
jgi:ribosomal-protein-alanine N-acetyltransferase